MALKTYPYDGSRYLDSEESQRELLSDALGTGHATYIAHAIAVVAKARGMTALAREAGMPREVLYEALADDAAPDVDTLVDVLRRLGIEPSAQAAE
jgi:probable addiction module antidote protein